MNTKTIGILGVALVALAGITALTLNHRDKSVQSAETHTKLFPNLAASLKDAAKVVVKKKAGEFTLERKGSGWGLAEKNGYAVEAEPVRKLLLALSEMETVEAKTQSKELYSQLGVEDVDGDAAKSALVTVQDGAGKELARLIVGKNYESKNYGGPGQSYVRKPGDAQSWLVKGQLDLKEKGADWLSKKILEVKRERMRTVSIVHPDGQKVEVHRDKPEQTDYTLADVPEGKELKYATIASTLASGLEYVNLEDVQPAGAIDFAKDPGPTATFTCFDGLVVTVRCKEQDGKTYAQYSAAFVEPPAPAGPEPEAPKDAATAKKSPDEVKKEVEELNARLGAWTYEISSYNRSAYWKRMDDLVQDKKPPTPPEGAAGDGTYKIPSDLPPEIQEQIKQHQESLGHKTEVVPVPPKPEGGVPADGSTPPAAKPDGGAPPAPDAGSTPPHR